MKKIAKWLALATAFISITIASCSNLFNDATVSSPDIGKDVTLYATSESDIVIFGENGENARTIMPGIIDVTATKDDKALYKFYLWGEDKLHIIKDDSIGTPKEVQFTATDTAKTTGTVNLNLEVSQYELYLAVVPASVSPDSADATRSAAVLFATATVDFRSSDSVNFFLSPYKLSANGGAELTVYADGWDVPSTHTVTIGIYDINTDEAITGITENKSFTLPKVSKPSDIPDKANYTSDKTAIAPGTYNFVVKLVPTPASGLKKTYYYSDKIVILSNQVTTQTIAIPNILTTLPTIPDNFGVSYLNPLTADSDYYEVQFVWEDKSYNEDYFKLELLDFTELTKKTNSTDDTDENAGFISKLNQAQGKNTTELDNAWGESTSSSGSGLRLKSNLSGETLYTFGKTTSYLKGSSTTAVNTGYFYNNPEFWVDGSLNKNSQYTVLRLPLGHRYFARLCAVNDVGQSKYLYADITGTSVSTKTNYKRYGTTSVSSTDLNKFGASTEINLFRITYNLNEGTFYQATGDKLKELEATPTKLDNIKGINAVKTAVVQYGTHKSTSPATILNPLHAPNTDSSVKYGILHDGDMNCWTNWLQNNANGEIYTTDYKDNFDKETPVFTEKEYKDHNNLDLYATYRISKAATKIDQSSNYNITKDMVKVFSNTNTGFPTTAPVTATNGIYQFVNSKTADANATGSTPAQYIYVALVNDAANNVVSGTPVAYDKVVMKVLKNGISTKQTSTATKTSGTINFTGKKANGDASSTASASYVEIPISAYAAGKYAVQIHAYANTQQGEYTYTIYFEVLDPSGTPASPTPTFTASTKKFQFSDIPTPGGTPSQITAITNVSSATEAVLTATLSGDEVTVKSVSAGSSDVTLSDGTNSWTVTFTVAATGDISVPGITLND